MSVFPSCLLKSSANFQLNAPYGFMKMHIAGIHKTGSLNASSFKHKRTLRYRKLKKEGKICIKMQLFISFIILARTPTIFLFTLPSIAFFFPFCWKLFTLVSFFVAFCAQLLQNNKWKRPAQKLFQKHTKVCVCVYLCVSFCEQRDSSLNGATLNVCNSDDDVGDRYIPLGENPSQRTSLLPKVIASATSSLALMMHTQNPESWAEPSSFSLSFLSSSSFVRTAVLSEKMVHPFVLAARGDARAQHLAHKRDEKRSSREQKTRNFPASRCCVGETA